MRYGPEHKQQTRDRVLHAAARSLRRHGVERVAVAEIMREAGLTHGGFYAHFASKDDLVTHAVARMFEDAVANFDRVAGDKPPAQGMQDYVDFYLSRRHWAERDRACPLASLGTDVPRLPVEARAAFERGAAALASRIAGKLEEMRIPAAGEAGVALLAQLVGSLLLARAVQDEARAAALLRSARHQLMLRVKDLQG